MNFNLTEITSNAIVVVPIVIALVQAVKLTGRVSDHYAPLVAIVIGVGVAFLGEDYNDFNLTQTILSGAVYGLMASGLYSGVKTTMIAHVRMKEQRKSEKFSRNRNDGC